MVFRNRSRGLQLRPVQRIKHVVDRQAGIGFGANLDTSLIIATDTPVLAQTDEVQTASTVHGIYLKVELYARTNGALSNAYMIIFKNPGGNLTLPAANNVGTSDNKKYVIHQEMIMLQRAINGNPRTLFNGVVVIPRGYKQFGINDSLVVRITSPGVDLDVCLQCHYKEFR